MEKSFEQKVFEGCTDSERLISYDLPKDIDIFFEDTEEGNLLKRSLFDSVVYPTNGLHMIAAKNPPMEPKTKKAKKTKKEKRAFYAALYKR